MKIDDDINERIKLRFSRVSDDELEEVEKSLNESKFPSVGAGVEDPLFGLESIRPVYLLRQWVQEEKMIRAQCPHETFESKESYGSLLSNSDLIPVAEVKVCLKCGRIFVIIRKGDKIVAVRRA
jgi:hypothetical protein